MVVVGVLGQAGIDSKLKRGRIVLTSILVGMTDLGDCHHGYYHDQDSSG